MKTFFLFLLPFIFFIQTDSCFSQVYSRSWVNTYGNDSVPYNFEPVQMCISKSGNVYVVSNKDTVGSVNMIGITRYDSLGNIIWDRVYANPYGYEANAKCMACDAEENIIIGGSDYDYLVLKYDSAGNLKWTFHYNAVGNEYDEVKALQPDSFGNIYITGIGALTGDPYYYTDALTCKLDSSGNLTWFSYYNYPVTTTAGDYASFLKLNTEGEVIIGGTFNGTNSLCKYDTSGNLLWTSVPSPFQFGGMELDDSANCYVINYMSGQDVPIVKYDSSGSIQWNKFIHYQNGGNLVDILIKENFLYVTGFAILDTAHKQDVLVGKYNLDGDTIWTRTFNNTANLADVGFKILCDSSDNLVVVGRTQNPGSDYDILMLKYDSSGNYLWEYQLSDTSVNEYFTDAILDSSGNLYIGGFSNYYNFYNEVAKVSNAGNLQWINQRVDYQDGNDYGMKIIRDAAGDLITAGLSISKTQGMDIVLIKYNTAGNQLWKSRISFASHNSMLLNQVMCDQSGNIYLCGAYDSIGSPDYYHALTAKLDASGNIIWYSIHDSLYNAVSFAQDSQENLYVLGNIRLAQYRYNAALLKYDAGGNLLWEKLVADSTAPSGQHILFDGSENFFISLTQANVQGNFGDITLLKIDTAGNRIWRRDFNGPAAHYDFCEDLLLDNNLNPILTGYSDSLDKDIVIIKYDSSGNYLWNYRYAGQGNSWDWPKDAALDGLNNIYVTGKSPDQNDVSDCITLKINSSGNLVWEALFDGNGSFPYDAGYALAVSDSGRVIVTGSTIDANSGTKILVLVYDSSGNQIFLDTTLVESDFLDDNKYDVVSGPDETFYVVSNQYSWQHMADIVTIKYGDIILKTEENAKLSNVLTAFPNPFSNTFSISCSSEKNLDATLEIINSSGLKVSEEKVRLQTGRNKFEIDASDLSAGFYNVVMKKSDGELATKRVISIK